MGIQSTVVFADLFGSTGVFEALGNSAATQIVTQETGWIAEKLAAHGGHIVKFLGDGVLATFVTNAAAIAAVLDVQRANLERLAQLPVNTNLPLRIGVARGEVEIVEDDCYGDAVNIAARLSEMTGAQQIWVNAATLDDQGAQTHFQARSLGQIHVRGRSEPCLVHQLEWQENIDSDLYTVQAMTNSELNALDQDVLGRQVELSWRDNHKTFRAFELPIEIGRNHQAAFVVNDPRVSRSHARIEWRNGSVFFVDLSSFGCWLRFAGADTELALRREECVLHGSGEVALGSKLSDPNAAVVRFSVR